MSHQKVFGGIMESHEFLCDGEGCDESYEDAGSFVEVLDKAKRKGWIAQKDAAGNWCHYCPDCNPDDEVDDAWINEMDTDTDDDWRDDT